MGFIKSIRSLFRTKAYNKIDLSTFNALGLDLVADVTEGEKQEMGQIIHEFNSFITEIDRLKEEYLDKALYGNMGKERAEEFLKSYKTVQEGYEHITGRFTESERVLYKKIYLIIPILDKLNTLKKCGENKKIYRDDFIELKKQMLERLMRLFGSSSDLPDFEDSIDKLKEIGMIPKDFGFGDMVKYCALGRWY